MVWEWPGFLPGRSCFYTGHANAQHFSGRESNSCAGSHRIINSCPDGFAGMATGF